MKWSDEVLLLKAWKIAENVIRLFSTLAISIYAVLHRLFQKMDSKYFPCPPLLHIVLYFAVGARLWAT